VIDLSGVRLLDSAGPGALMSLRNEADRAGGALGLVCPCQSLVRVFSVTGLRPAFMFGDDLAAVRAALAARRAPQWVWRRRRPMSARGRMQRSVPTPSAPAGAAPPRALPCGLLIVQGANLEDAVAELARIDGRMRGQSDASMVRHGWQRSSCSVPPPAASRLSARP